MVNTVGFNLTLAAIRSLVKGGLISQRARRAMVGRSIRDYRIKTASPDAPVASLSGGNQQKVVVAKWLASNPSLLILDEPTRGVDVGAKQEIYAIMNDLAAKGMAIVMVSSDLPEIINMCDRVCVMRAGRLVANAAAEQITQENIMKFATGERFCMREDGRLKNNMVTSMLRGNAGIIAVLLIIAWRFRFCPPISDV